MSPLTTFLSRLIGLFCILISVSMAAHRQATVQTVTALVYDPPLLLIVGMIGLTAGVAIVLGHSVWSGGVLPVVVSLVGWLILIKGLLFLFIPPDAAITLFERLHYDQFFFGYVAISFIFASISRMAASARNGVSPQLSQPPQDDHRRIGAFHRNDHHLVCATS